MKTSKSLTIVFIVSIFFFSATYQSASQYAQNIITKWINEN